jgi:hypothetical protein
MKTQNCLDEVVMSYIISPFEGVNDWKFGMSRDEIRKLVKSFPKVISGIDLKDIYHDLDLHFFYNYGEPFILHAMMTVPPICIYLNDKNLLGGESIKDLGNWFKERYDSVDINGDGVFVYSLGIYLSTQSMKLFSQEPPESVVVFSKDSPYWDLGRS